MAWSKQAKALAANSGVKGMKKGIRKPKFKKPLPGSMDAKRAAGHALRDPNGKAYTVHPKVIELGKKHFFRDSLTDHGSDSMDFKEVSTWGIREGIHEAYAHGRGEKGARMSDADADSLAKKHFGRDSVTKDHNSGNDFSETNGHSIAQGLSAAMAHGRASRKKGIVKNSSFVPAINYGVKGMKKGVRKAKPLVKGRMKKLGENDPQSDTFKNRAMKKFHSVFGDQDGAYHTFGENTYDALASLYDSKPMGKVKREILKKIEAHYPEYAAQVYREFHGSNTELPKGRVK